MFNKFYTEQTMEIINSACASAGNMADINSLDLLIAIKINTELLPNLNIESMDDSLSIRSSDNFSNIINGCHEIREDFNYNLITPEILLSALYSNPNLASHLILYSLFGDGLVEKLLDIDDEDLPEDLLINQFGVNLNEQVALGNIDPVIGREKELSRLIQILARRTKNNPCIIGEPGVGKTVLVNELARLIVNGDVPEKLLGKFVYSLDITNIVAGTKYRGDFEQRIKNILNEVKERGNIILFIDEFHMVVGAGSTDGSMDMSNIIKPLLTRGDVQIIGATTSSEYKKVIEKQAALDRRFQQVLVEEPDSQFSINILKGLRETYENYYGIAIPDETIEAAVYLTQKYVPYRCLPDKAIDALDEALSKKKIETSKLSSQSLLNKKAVAELIDKRKDHILRHQYDQAIESRAKINHLKNSLNMEASNTIWPLLNPEDIADLVSMWTGVPANKMTETEIQLLANLEDVLHSKIIGQDKAVTCVSQAIRRNRSGFRDSNKPIGSFIFVGSSGIGKTALAKSLASTLFGSEENMIRVDMSEFMEKHSTSRIIGSPPGYVGYDEGGQLTDQIRKKPYCVLLFDEIEKAHPDVFNILLQVLDDGYITDSQGKRISFKNTLIIMTSNLGTKDLFAKASLGFNSSAEISQIEIDSKINAELKKFFRPEFLNRIDDIVVFKPLSIVESREIVNLNLRGIIKNAKEKGLELEFSAEVLDFIVDKGFSKEYGARPLKRTIQKYIENLLSDLYISQKIVSGDHLTFKVEEDTIACNTAVCAK